MPIRCLSNEFCGHAILSSLSSLADWTRAGHALMSTEVIEKEEDIMKESYFPMCSAERGQHEPGGDQVRRISTRFVMALSPNFACWQCEEPLPPRFCGVWAETEPHPTLLVTCSPECQGDVLRQSEGKGVEVCALKSPKVRALLDRDEDIISIVEGQRMADGLLVAPYGEGPRGIVRERLAMALRAREN